MTKIRCVSPGDDGYPVRVDGTPKECRFDLKGEEALVTCDREKFSAKSESGQYQLVHHEYAGIADIEIPNRDVSTYEFSNQISGFLVDTIVKKLAVLNPSYHIPVDQWFIKVTPSTDDLSRSFRICSKQQRKCGQIGKKVWYSLEEIRRKRVSAKRTSVAGAVGIVGSLVLAVVTSPTGAGALYFGTASLIATAATVERAKTAGTLEGYNINRLHTAYASKDGAMMAAKVLSEALD